MVGNGYKKERTTMPDTHTTPDTCRNNAQCGALGAVYLVPRGFEHALLDELRLRGLTVLFQRERLVATAEAPVQAVWAENIWLSPEFVGIRSIKDGASRLKAIQRNWALYSTGHHRRAALIKEALPPVAAKPLVFGAPAPAAPLGSWTLWDAETILASAACSSPFPNGEVLFVEDRKTPPNRAYLKLWETFTRLGRYPGPGELCLDLGSSPGGWTWVLAGLGARVFSVDKAPLAEHIEKHPYVEYCSGSAFAVEPHASGDIDWIFCDVACYPERLYNMVKKWIDAETNSNMICTVKLAGASDFSIVRLFLDIPGSFAMHLFANKHEVTWVRLVK